MAGRNLTADATAPAYDATAVVTSDTTVIPPTRALYVGATGNIKVRMAMQGMPGGPGNTITFSSVPVGIFPIQVDMVFAAGTTASSIVALY